jgi:hypothetical protein
VEPDIELVKVIGERFVQRKDVKAQQGRDGAYFPVWDNPQTKNRLPFELQDFYDHFSGAKTFGHYLLDIESNCKFFAFDIDLKANVEVDTPAAPAFTGQYFQINPLAESDAEAFPGPYSFDPRAAWRDRSHPSRPWVKLQMRTLAHTLTKTIEDLLGIPAAAAYTGNKGIHVYGFTGTHRAQEVRDGAEIVLKYLDCWEPARGKAFWKHKDSDPFTGFPNFSLEVFPKQTTLDGKDLGNLMRLPLGRNQKAPEDPTFFIDLRSPMGELRPVADPIELLRSGNNWS